MKAKRVATILGGVFASLVMMTAQSAVIYYQPTPYPAKKIDGTSMPQSIGIVHSWQGWFGSVYNKTYVQDGNLQIGGWGDYYTSPLRFDTNGLPAVVDKATLYLYAVPSGSANPSQMSIFRIASDWSPSTVGWSSFPSTSGGYYWPVSTTVNAWRGYTITDWYNGWKSGTYSNYGILLWPYNSDSTQRFDRFLSMRSTDQPHRPMLALTFTPTLSLKMPLPGGYSWLPSTEVGGYDCMGATPFPDTAHQGENYFSIDFTSANVLTTQQGPTPYTSSNTPILAAASGKVLIVGTDEEAPNGYHIILDHDYDGKASTGFQTRYLHFVDVPKRKNGVALKVGDTVSQGDQLGIMGDSGPYSTGVHLHFGVRYKDSGNMFVNDVAKVVMDGKLLKGYQTECKVSTSGIPEKRILYYPSTNTLTGK